RGGFLDLRRHMGVAAQGSHHRSPPVPRSYVWHLQPADVHVGICALGQHAAPAPVLADSAGLYGGASRSGADAWRIYHHYSPAPGGILAFALQSALASFFRIGSAFWLSVPHDHI